MITDTKEKQDRCIPLLKRLLIGLFFVVSAFFLYSLLGQDSLSDKSSVATQRILRKKPGRRTSRPLILAWTPYYSTDLAKRLSEDIEDCEHKCKIVNDKNRLELADAAVFHIRDVNTTLLPPTRSVDQLFVFFLMESPYHTGEAFPVTPVASQTFFGPESPEIPNDYFNITMTYRTDGDILFGYGKLERIDGLNSSRRDSPTFDYDKIEESVRRRTKSVLQFVSHCETPSQRELYVRKLSKYIDVRQIGLCSNKSCSKRCEKKAAAEHLFYLSFENSVCRDYVTEKLFDRLGHFVPIVLKRSINKGIVPDEAFIAADDFESPKQLADYLRFLQGNHTALMRYFNWTKSYKLAKLRPGCDLCRILHERSDSTFVVPNMRKWWYEKSHCQNNYVSKMFIKNGYRYE